MSAIPAVSSEYEQLRQYLAERVAETCSLSNGSVLLGLSKKFDATFSRLSARLASSAGSKGLESMLKSGKLSDYVITRIGLIVFLSFSFLVLLSTLIITATLVFRVCRANARHQESSLETLDEENTTAWGSPALPPGKSCGGVAEKKSLSMFSGISGSSMAKKSRKFLKRQNHVFCSPTMRYWWAVILSACIAFTFLLLCLVCIVYIAYYHNKQKALQCNMWAVFQGYFFGAYHINTPHTVVPDDWRGSYPQLVMVHDLRKMIEFPSSSTSKLAQTSLTKQTVKTPPAHAANSSGLSRDSLCPICTEVYDNFYNPTGLRNFLIYENHRLRANAMNGSVSILGMDKILSSISYPKTDREYVRHFFYSSFRVLNSEITTRLLLQYAERLGVTTKKALAIVGYRLQQLLTPELPIFVEAKNVLEKGWNHLMDVDFLVSRTFNKWKTVASPLRKLNIGLVAFTILCGLVGVSVAIGSLTIVSLIVFKRVELKHVTRWVFLIFATLLVFTGITLVLSASLFFLAAAGSDVCTFSNNALFRDGRWQVLPAPMWKETKSNLTDMDVVLNTCVKRRGDGDISTALGLRFAMSHVKSLFEVETRRTYEQLNRHMALDELFPEIVSLSRLVGQLPYTTALPPPILEGKSFAESPGFVSIVPFYASRRTNYVSLHPVIPSNLSFIPALDLLGRSAVSVWELMKLAPQSVVADPLGFEEAVALLNAMAKNYSSPLSFCTEYLKKQNKCDSVLPSRDDDSVVMMLKFHREDSDIVADVEKDDPSYYDPADSAPVSNALYKSLWTNIGNDNPLAGRLFLRLTSLVMYADYVLTSPLENKTFKMSLPAPDPVEAAVLYYEKERKLPLFTYDGALPQITTEDFMTYLFPNSHCFTNAESVVDGKQTDSCTVGGLYEAWSSRMKILSADILDSFIRIQNVVTGFVSDTVGKLGAVLKLGEKMLENFNCQFLGTALDHHFRQTACQTLIPSISALALLFLFISCIGAFGSGLAFYAYRLVASKSESFARQYPHQRDPSHLLAGHIPTSSSSREVVADQQGFQEFPLPSTRMRSSSIVTRQ